MYMCTIRLIELTVASQTSKPVSCKMHPFLQNAIKFCIAIQRFCMKQYPSFIYVKTQLYIFPMLGLRFFFLFFLQTTGIEKPDYMVGTACCLPAQDLL